MDQQEYVALVKEIAKGDRNAEALLGDALRAELWSLAQSSAKKSGAEPGELLEIALVHILVVVRQGKYDESRASKFVSWAKTVAQHRMMKENLVPYNQYTEIQRIEEAADDLRKTLNRDPTPGEIAAKTGYTEEVLRSRLNRWAISAPDSLNAPAAPNQTDNWDFREAIQYAEEWTIVVACMEALSVFEQKLLILSLVQEIPNKTIAARFKRKPNNIAKAKQRAIERLRDLFVQRTKTTPFPNIK